MRLLLSLITSILLANCGLSAPPEVPRELKVKPGQVISILVKTDKKLGIAKDFGTTDGFFGELVSPVTGQRQFMFQSPMLESDGTYKGKSQYGISWWAEGELEGTTTTVLIDTGRVVPPDPKPIPPDPKPVPPDPIVKVDKVWVIVVEDAQAPRTVSTATLLNDPYWQTVKPKNEFRHYLSSSQTAISNGYVEEAKSVGFPVVLIIDAKDGAVIKKFKASTIGEIDSVIKQVTK